MPLFRRAPRPTAELTVGMHHHRVVVGGREAGITQLPELRDYVGRVTGHAAELQDGRDPVAVLSAKMDYAELVDDLAVVVGLAFEDLAGRGLVSADVVPPRPELPPVPAKAAHYEYIQAAHARACVRMEWLEAADAVLVAQRVAILPPLPPEEERPRLR